MTPGFGFSMAYTVNFERATVDYDVARGADALRLWVEGQPVQVIKVGDGDGYLHELAYAVDCVRTGRRPARVTAADGLSAVELCEAEAESIRTGAPVRTGS